MTIFLLLLLTIGLTLLSSTRLVTHAAGILLKPSPKRSQASVTSITGCGSWSIIPNPTSTGAGPSLLTAVASISVNDAWAVGSYHNFSRTLIEHWNGTSWNVVSSPNPDPGLGYNDLRGVAGISTHNVWAVGMYRNSSGITQTLIEHWNGTQWSIVPSPSPGVGGNSLFGIAALSSHNITVVGSYFNTDANAAQTLIEHWNGTRWLVVSSQNVASASNYLYGVSVLSTNNKWAVGVSFINNSHQTLIEHWDGTSWSVVPSPNLSSYNDLYHVAAVSTNDIWTVGTASLNTLVEHWDGTQWSIIPSPSPGSGAKSLNGVIAISSSNVWAVGNAQTGPNGTVQTLTEHWDGANWSVVPSPNPNSSNGMLNAVAQVPGMSSQIWAVGTYSDTNNIEQTLTEFYC